MMVPDLMLTNSAKFTFADNFHEMCKIAQDICGGIATTVPSYRDWKNPETHDYIEKYLGGKAGIPTADRIKAIRLIKDMTHNYYQIDHIHGEGSRAAQQIFLYMSANWKKYVAAAKRECRIDGWQSDCLLLMDALVSPPLSMRQAQEISTRLKGCRPKDET
jgi:4-hydroxybutyryl-CoA dehydratase/vinylacetyl-CoA-Delta-isomerase